MTTTTGADGPLYVGPPYVFASFDRRERRTTAAFLAVVSRESAEEQS